MASDVGEAEKPMAYLPSAQIIDTIKFSECHGWSCRMHAAAWGGIPLDTWPDGVKDRISDVFLYLALEPGWERQVRPP